MLLSVCINLFVTPFVHVIIILRASYLCKRKGVLNPLQAKWMMLCTVIIYIVMMLTVFQMGCSYFGIGASWEEGIFLAIVWSVSLAIAGVFLLVLVGGLIYSMRGEM